MLNSHSPLFSLLSVVSHLAFPLYASSSFFSFFLFLLYCRFLHAGFLTLRSFTCNTHTQHRRCVCCVQQLNQNRSNGKILLFLTRLCLCEEAWICSRFCTGNRALFSETFQCLHLLHYFSLRRLQTEGNGITD